MLWFQVSFLADQKASMSNLFVERWQGYQWHFRLYHQQQVYDRISPLSLSV